MTPHRVSGVAGDTVPGGCGSTPHMATGDAVEVNDCVTPMKSEKKDSDMNNPTFKNEAHDLVIDEDTAEDFFGMNLSDYLNGLATSYLTPTGVWDDMHTVAEHASIAEWAGVAVMMGYDKSGVVVAERLVDPTSGVDDAPHYEHACEWLVDLSNARAMRRMLLSLEDKTEEDNENLCEGNGWLFWENKLWFDPTNEAVRSIIESCEVALSDYPLIGEDRHSELEHEYLEMMAESQWSLWSGCCDDTIDEDEVKQAFIDTNSEGNRCDLCGFSADMDDVIRGMYHECGCDDFTADTNDDGEGECESCRGEREAEEAEAKSWIGETVTEGLLSGYRLVVTQDVDAKSPTTWGDHVTKGDAVHRRWARGDVSIVSMEKLTEYFSEDDPEDFIQFWRTTESLGDCYLSKDYTPLTVAREHGWEGVDYTND